MIPLCIYLWFKNPLEIAWYWNNLFVYMPSFLWIPRMWYITNLIKGIGDHCSSKYLDSLSSEEARSLKLRATPWPMTKMSLGLRLINSIHSLPIYPSLMTEIMLISLQKKDNLSMNWPANSITSRNWVPLYKTRSFTSWKYIYSNIQGRSGSPSRIIWGSNQGLCGWHIWFHYQHSQ